MTGEAQERAVSLQLFGVDTSTLVPLNFEPAGTWWCQSGGTHLW